MPTTVFILATTGGEGLATQLLAGTPLLSYAMTTAKCLNPKSIVVVYHESDKEAMAAFQQASEEKGQPFDTSDAGAGGEEKKHQPTTVPVHWVAVNVPRSSSSHNGDDEEEEEEGESTEADDAMNHFVMLASLREVFRDHSSLLRTLTAGRKTNDDAAANTDGDGDDENALFLHANMPFIRPATLAGLPLAVRGCGDAAGEDGEKGGADTGAENTNTSSLSLLVTEEKSSCWRRSDKRGDLDEETRSYFGRIVREGREISEKGEVLSLCLQPQKKAGNKEDEDAHKQQQNEKNGHSGEAFTGVFAAPFGLLRLWLENEEKKEAETVREEDIVSLTKRTAGIDVGGMTEEFNIATVNLTRKQMRSSPFVFHAFAAEDNSNRDAFEELTTVWDFAQLAAAERRYQRFLAHILMRQHKVRIVDPSRFDLRSVASIVKACSSMMTSTAACFPSASLFSFSLAALHPTLTIGSGVFIDINVILEGSCHIGNGVSVGAGCVIRNSRVGDGTRVQPFSIIEDAVVGAGAVVGPYARLRPGATLGDQVHIGNFVEVKNSVVGFGSKVNHLTYLGDATIGTNCNIGAGTITCNYDGVNKHRTTIGNDAFIGTNNALVAPVIIGNGATTGAGSVITQNVPDGALGLERSRQIIKESYQRPQKGGKHQQ